MKLGKKQEEFAQCLAGFILWIYAQGWAVRLGEGYRTKEQALIYVKQGKGILNSAHRKKLAQDLFLVVDGKITWNTKDYIPLAKKWGAMHPLARAGHNFKGRDSVHFSFEHRGIK